MTEKRFTLNYEINNYEDFMVKDNQKEKILYDEDIEKLLNEQDQKIKKTKEVLQKHYDYAYDQRQKNLDNAIVAEVYNVLRYTVVDIADELSIEIKK